MAAEQLPTLAAAIPLDDAKRPLTRMKPSGPVKLIVRNYEEGEYMSYDELAQRSFTPADYDVSLVPVCLASTDPTESARKACFVQLNFIPGGIILGFDPNHIAMDVGAMDLALALVCGCAKACMEDRPARQQEFCYDRQLFIAPEEMTAQTKEQIIAANAKSRVLKVFDAVGPDIASTAKDEESQEAESTPSPTCKIVMYRITDPDAKRLKASCKALARCGVEYVSTYDCMVALVFRALVRIRTTLDPSLKSKEWRYVHPLNLRARRPPVVPKNYFGNAVIYSPPIFCPSTIFSVPKACPSLLRTFASRSFVLTILQSSE